MSEKYEIDEETMEMCRALEYYDINKHFPWEKKKIIISLSYNCIEKLKGKNKSKIINDLILKDDKL